MALGRLDGRPVVVSGGGDDTVRVWDLATGAPVGAPFTGHTNYVLAVAVGELDGRPVAVSGGADRASGGADSTVRVWDLASGNPIGRPFIGHTDWVTSVAVGQLGGRPVVVSGSEDKTVRVDLATGAPVGQPFTGHTDTVSAVAVGQLGGRPVVVSGGAVSGGADRTVRTWDLTTRAGT